MAGQYIKAKSVLVRVKIPQITQEGFDFGTGYDCDGTVALTTL
jgi:hypothetical protein